MTAAVADLPYALGRIPATPDPRNLRLTTYTEPDRAPAPTAANWLRLVDRWPLYGNDRVGDCEVAACAHLTTAWTRYAGSEVVLPDADVYSAYTALTGWDPRTGENDNGVRTADMLSYWRHTGVGGRKIVAYVAVNPADHEQVRYATHLFGGLLIGLNMPLSAGVQTRQRRIWTSLTGPNSEPGSWGAHAAHLGAYDKRWLTCTTWGLAQRMTWSFWDRYVTEATAIISPDWITPSGLNPLGFRMDTLLADLAAL